MGIPKPARASNWYNENMISRIAIKNYRSLRDVELRPGPLTVLIGPNGAGKSNIIDALKFLKGVCYGSSETDILAGSQLAERGGFGQVVWGGLTDEKIKLEVEFSASERTPHILRGLGVKVQGPPEFRALAHTFPIDADTREVTADASVINNEYRKEIDRRLQSWQFYNFSPALMRKPTKVKQESLLNESGSNLSTVIHSLFSEGHPDLEEAVGMLQVMAPTVERLVSPIYGDGQTYVALKEKGVKQPTGAWGLSDGTLLALALSVALVVDPLPNLICLETPEAEIHPSIMEAVADLLTAASYHAQVIVTTQSPYLLDQLPYEQFVIVEKKAGETRLRPLTVEEEDREFFREVGVGNAWFSGSIGGVPWDSD